MLKRLMRAIAQIIMRTTQPTVGIPVPPTQPAGPASQEPTTPAGNKRSAQTTKPRKSSLAPARSPKKPKAVQPTTAVAKSSSKKQKPVQTGKSQSTRGNSTPTRASKTRQHAK